MLSIKQREEREALVAKREGLREELAFAVEHKKPWQWGSWESGNVYAAACEKHGDYQRISLTGKAYRGVENVKHSQCPECVKAELAGIESSLRTLRVAMSWMFVLPPRLAPIYPASLKYWNEVLPITPPTVPVSNDCIPTLLPALGEYADVKSDGVVSVPPLFPFTVPSRESSPAATVPAAVPTSLVALFPKPTFYRLLSSGLADNFT